MSGYQELKGHRDLKVYQLAYRLAMEIFNLVNGYEEVGKMLGTMMSMHEKFTPRNSHRE